MTTRSQETESSQQPQAPRAAAWPLALAGLIVAAVQATRPRQWPKNLLVFAAPLAGATLGGADGFGYALVAFAAFTAASSAVYLINDVTDAERDRLHPVKRLRPIASGRLPRLVAIGLAIAGLGVALLASLAIGEPRLAGVIGAYVTMSMLYSLGLKNVPGAELLVVALGFVLRAIGGAVATRVPPSAWFLVVCSLGALMVAIGKRYTELSVLGREAAAHRPVMRWYLRDIGNGTIVILSSVAAIRPRKANFVYGAAKAGLDAFGRGLADSLHGSGVRVLLVRPGFVIGRMTAGLDPAPLATTPEQVGAAVAAGLAGRASLIWVPASLGPAAILMRLVPRRIWRQLRR